MPIRCNTTLGALVQFWTKTQDNVVDQDEFDFTGYGAFYSSVKHKLTDAAELMRLTVTVSVVDVDGNAVGPEKGWLQFYAPPEETINGQTIAESVASGIVRGRIDVIGVDSNGNRVPIGTGFADIMPSTTETFA